VDEFTKKVRVMLKTENLLSVNTTNVFLTHCQNMGSYEDIATACLATMFHLSDDFMEKFLRDMGVPAEKVTLLIENKVNIACGDKIKNSYHRKWLGDDTPIEFEPDVWLSQINGGFWDWDKEQHAVDIREKPGCFNVLIESKFFSTLTPGQVVGYKYVREKIRSENKESLFYNIFIGFGDDGNEYPEQFDKWVTWEHVIDVSKKLAGDLDDTPERAQIFALIELLECRIYPRELLSYDLENNYEQNYQDFLKCLFRRLKISLGIEEGKKKKSARLCSTTENPENKGIYLYLNDRKDYLWAHFEKPDIQNLVIGVYDKNDKPIQEDFELSGDPKEFNASWLALVAAVQEYIDKNP
jgi:hypothetical protein